MNQSKFSLGPCSISDDWTYKNMQVVWMENDFVRIGILVGRGGDIFEFRFKPLDLNFMLRLNKEIHNPAETISQMRDTTNQMEDYYYGGWQEVLPNSAAGVYRGASLGQHGEVWMIPWKHSIIMQDPDKVAVKLWVRPLRIPLLIEKTLTLTFDAPTLKIEERLVNESMTHLDLMWGHHIAFGLPFLSQGGIIKTNATQVIAEQDMPEHRLLNPGVTYDWPNMENIAGVKIDASKIPAREEPPYCDLAYLSGFAKEAYYQILNPDESLGFSVKWNADIFKYLWYWQERYATQDAPWWGSAYAIALEPWTSKHPNNPERAIAAGEYLLLEPGQIIYSEMEASIINK
jgi:galactose mutarotase-like enzyme